MIYHLKCKNVKNTTGGCFGIGGVKGKLRYEIRRQVGRSNHWASSYMSPPVEGTRDPIWSPQRIKFAKFANADPEAKVQVRLLVGDIEVGHMITTSTELHDKRVFDVMSPNGKSKGQGQIEFVDFQLIEVPSFINYLEGGLKISFAVAIDFTASNGNPAKRSSLHYIGNTNQYEKALFQVGSILEPYSHDQNFPTFGFGGVPKGER